MQRILLPWMHYLDANIGGVANPMGDLYPPWRGSRELLLRHKNPYGPEVTREIQMTFYGHPVSYTDPHVGGTVKNEQRFAYPLYTVFLLAPTVFTDFEDLRIWVRVVLGLLTAASILLWLDVLHWRPPWQTVVALILFSVSTPQIVQGLRLDQLGLLVGFFLAGAAWLVRRGHLKMAGILLALSTIKPQMTLLPLCCFAVWALGAWRSRWTMAGAFAAAMAVLLLGSEALLPGWFGFFLAGISVYRKYAPAWSLLGLVAGDTLADVMGIFLILALLRFAWRVRKEAPDSRAFVLVLAASLMITCLVFPLFVPFNQVLLILPAMLLMQDWKYLPLIPRGVFVACVGWAWIVSLVLLVFPPPLDSPRQLPLLPSFLISFIPFFLPLLLMTRRHRDAASPVLAAGSPAA